MSALRQLIHEIHRRSLWQVLTIYVAASWGVMSVVDTFSGALNLPDGFDPDGLVLLILGLGLPIVVATAFIAGGATHDEPDTADLAPAPSPGSTPGDAAGSPNDALSEKWRQLAVTFAALFILVGGLAGWSLLRPQPSNLPSSSFEITLPDGLTHVTDAGSTLAISPDGSQVVFVARTEDGVPQLWRRALDSILPAAIPGTEYGRNPAFSPDGLALGFVANGRLLTVPLAGGPPNPVVLDSVYPGGLAWGADRQIYFSKTGLGIWAVPEGGGDEYEVSTLEPGEVGHRMPSVFPNASGLAFTRSKGTRTTSEVSIISLDTGEEMVPRFPGVAAMYVRSGHIVYALDGTLRARPFDLARNEFRGPARALIGGVYSFTSTDSYFAISESGALVYRPDGQTGNVPMWIGRDGAQEVLDSALSGFFQHPSISPDGEVVAFEYNNRASEASDIWLYHLGQRTFDPFTRADGNDRRPFWSPDGEHLGFVSDRDGIYSLFVRPSDESAPETLLRAPTGPDLPLYEGLWSGDGRWLVYRQGTSPLNADVLYTAPHPDSASTTILDTPFLERTPDLDPNDRWLVYQSDKSGTNEIYVRPFRAAGREVKVSLDGGTNPVWSRDGSSIFYVDEDDLVWRVARVRTEPEFEVVARERFASANGFVGASANRQYDVSPDGQRLLAIRFNEPTLDRVIQNFFEELRETLREN